MKNQSQGNVASEIFKKEKEEKSVIIDRREERRDLVSTGKREQ